MGFVRAKEIPPGSDNWYDYEVKNYREGDKVVQKHIRYIGKSGHGGGASGGLGTTQSDAIAIKAKQIFDTTRPTPQMLKFYGEKNLSPIQRATLAEIEAHLRLVDRIGKEYGKTLNPEKYPLGTTEDAIRESAKIYWTKGKRIQASKNLSAKQDRQRELIQEALKIQPDSNFLKSLMEQTYHKHHQLSAKQVEVVEKIIHDKQALGTTQPPPENKPLETKPALGSAPTHIPAPELTATKLPSAPLGTTRGNKELKHASLPALDKGEIYATRNEGVFVVESSRPAQWRGEDADVYGHINTWYTIRPATPQETELWDDAVKAAKARNEMRSQLNVSSFYSYNPNTRELQPSAASTRRLDSYDDRWEPPKSILLTDAQIAIEERYIQAQAARKLKA